MTAPTLIDFRVMYQYNNPPPADDLDPELVRPSHGPRFEFTTMMATSADSAAEEVALIHHRDQNFAIVQVVEANHYVTGFTQ